MTITPDEFIGRLNNVIHRLGNSPSADPVSMNHMSSCAGELADLRDIIVGEKERHSKPPAPVTAPETKPGKTK